jgi:predicted flap endonuclease-1-like 5' DNA nuclease
MDPQLQQYLPAIIIVAILAILIAGWLLMRSSRRTKVVDRTSGDVLDEGAQRAARNQALIDAPHAVEKVFGETSANANSQATGTAGETADAEAGVSVAPTVGDPVPPRTQKEAEQPAAAIPASGGADDLKRIKGVGPKLVALLAEHGVTRFDQIAAWTEADIDRIDAQLGRFQGRIRRDQWVAQAKLLAAGDEKAFSETFGNNR